ncbi:MAG: hypothetical protein KME17_20470 [Cyanosarcina radialis HA8281-LM2]|jgi:hypothetical protein|nr:hypothetical protein [Cyanosarcina radialis HA8281-LM2]
MFKTILVGISILLAIAFGSLAIGQIRSQQEVDRIWQTLASAPTPKTFTKEAIADLPEPVQRYFLRAIALGTPLATTVELDMQGQFRLASDKPWLPMQAQELLTSKGFVWQAKIGSGWSQFRGADYYFNRMGRMRFAVLGLIPVVNASNPDTARSAMGRMVAELMWLPSALLPQAGVEWSAIDDRTIEAKLKVDGEPVTLRLEIDRDGKLLSGYALRWGDRTPDGSWTYIPMGGKYYAERTFDGFTIPSQVGVGWWFGSDRYFEFFQGTIDRAEFN